MKILVVYGGPFKGLKKEYFDLARSMASRQINQSKLNHENQFFLSTVQKMIKNQTIAAVDEIEVISRHISDLKDYLFEMEPNARVFQKVFEQHLGRIDSTGLLKDTQTKQLFDVANFEVYNDPNAAQRFDYLDFIIVDVPATLLPWMDKSRQLTILFKQCKLTNKLLFFAGQGMSQMAFYCSMESKWISVINGREKGGNMAKIKEAVSIEMLQHLLPGFHVYMDNLTGDIFDFDQGKQQWNPIGNIGLHHSRAEASISGGIIGGLGDTMKKANIHKTSTSGQNQKPILIMTSDFDIKVDVRKSFLHHWMLKGVSHEFIVENKNTWDPHPINITNYETIQKSYLVLAEGSRGPQVAEHYNCIATQFPIRSKHKETVKILQNFITNALTKVANAGKVGIPLQQAYSQVTEKKQLIKAKVRQFRSTIGSALHFSEIPMEKKEDQEDTFFRKINKYGLDNITTDQSAEDDFAAEMGPQGKKAQAFQRVFEQEPPDDVGQYMKVQSLLKQNQATSFQNLKGTEDYFNLDNQASQTYSEIHEHPLEEDVDQEHYPRPQTHQDSRAGNIYNPRNSSRFHHARCKSGFAPNGSKKRISLAKRLSVDEEAQFSNSFLPPKDAKSARAAGYDESSKDAPICSSYLRRGQTKPSTNNMKSITTIQVDRPGTSDTKFGALQHYLYPLNSSSREGALFGNGGGSVREASSSENQTGTVDRESSPDQQTTKFSSLFARPSTSPAAGGGGGDIGTHLGSTMSLALPEPDSQKPKVSLMQRLSGLFSKPLQIEAPSSEMLDDQNSHIEKKEESEGISPNPPPPVSAGSRRGSSTAKRVSAGSEIWSLLFSTALQKNMKKTANTKSEERKKLLKEKIQKLIETKLKEDEITKAKRKSTTEEYISKKQKNLTAQLLKVKNNAVCKEPISMRAEIEEYLKKMDIGMGATYQSNQSQFVAPQAEKPPDIRSKNLRHIIAQKEQHDIIDRNREIVTLLSEVNKVQIENTKKKAENLDLPMGALEEIKNVRPVHSNSTLLRTFASKQAQYGAQSVIHQKKVQGTLFADRQTYYDAFNIKSREKTSRAKSNKPSDLKMYDMLQKQTMDIKKMDEANEQRSKRVSSMQSTAQRLLENKKQHFMKDKQDEIERVKNLLNYRDKLSVMKQNKQFQDQLNNDNLDTIQVKEQYQEQMAIETQIKLSKFKPFPSPGGGKNKRQSTIFEKQHTMRKAHFALGESLETSITKDPDDEQIVQGYQRLIKEKMKQHFGSQMKVDQVIAPLKKYPFTNRSMSSVNITSKNGYLFKGKAKKKREGHQSAREELYEVASDSNGSIHERSVRSCGTIKLTTKRHFCRYKYFESLPKFSMNQPCINVASPYVGDEHAQLRQDDLEKKKKWLTKQGFIAFGGKANALEAKQKTKDLLYVGADPSEPPMMHQFRRDDKETFLFGPFKAN